ncbi:unnamed protein product [Brassica oleracea]
MCIVYGNCTYDCGEINDSAKWPQENEWMTDPIAIGDIDGPEIQTALSLGSLTKRNLFGLDFVVDGVRVAELSTIVDMTGSYDSYP